MPGAGTGLLDFGAFPGATDATLVITGQAGIIASSLVEAWIFPDITVDHSEDEHMIEPFHVFVPKSSIVAETGFTIYGRVQALEYAVSNPILGGQVGVNGGQGILLYGKFNVAWAWY